MTSALEQSVTMMRSPSAKPVTSETSKTADSFGIDLEIFTEFEGSANRTRSASVLGFIPTGTAAAVPDGYQFPAPFSNPSTGIDALKTKFVASLGTFGALLSVLVTLAMSFIQPE